MAVHRLVATLSAISLLGLVGFASASNFAHPAKPKDEIRELRAQVKAAHIPGCSGEL